MLRIVASARARAAVVLLATAAALTATPAHAGTASLSGTITDSATGDPVAGVCVLAYQQDGDTWYEQYPESCTGDDGQWSSPSLDAGTYVVRASGPGYVTQFAYGAHDFWDAQQIALADGDAQTVDLTMVQAGAIAGTVTDATTGDPLDGICVDAQNDTSYGNACTNPDGTYEIDGLAPGDGYVVNFNDFSGAHIGEYAHDAHDYESAERFTVTAGETVQVDEDLDQAATISGHVTDASTGDSLANVCVLGMDQPESDDPTGGYACTDEDGNYQMTGVAPGTWYVAVDDDSGAHPRTWYPGTTDPAAAVAVTTTGGQDTSAVDVALSPAAYVSGTITRASTGQPLPDVCVVAQRASDDAFLRNGGPNICSDADGHYTVGGLPAGHVKIEFGPSGYEELLAQWAYGKDSAATASLIPVVAGQTTTGVNAAMREGGKITGRITNAKTHKPVEGACATVGVYSHRAGENGTQWPSACTGADGTYEIHGLPTGSYTVEFYDPDGAWAWQFFPNKGDRVQAAKLSVTAGTTLSGINAKLVPGGSITGVVTDSSTGQPAEGVCMDAYTARGQDEFGTGWCTGPDGHYELHGFPTTKVKVSFFDGSGHYASEWAFDKTSYTTATPIATKEGATVTANVTVSPAS